MKNKFILTGALLAALVPAAAFAQTNAAGGAGGRCHNWGSRRCRRRRPRWARRLVRSVAP